ncbi:MAG: recombination protein RecR [Candidatus Colwellbacteria bacterium]|nr:recombination protein RecR [Candidatus Colwellbacteria bacterium]
MRTPEAIRKFVRVFSELPGIGPRQATRLAFHVIHKGSGNQMEMAKAIADFKNIKICKRCFYIHENQNGLCDICADMKRNQKVIAVVEKETDLMSLENTAKFNGRYLILGDLRRTGILEADQNLRLKNLKNFIKEELGGKAEEIIIAINPNTYGDLNAALVAKELEGFALKLTRLGRGIPTGGEIEFADEDTLISALERRV